MGWSIISKHKLNIYDSKKRLLFEKKILKKKKLAKLIPIHLLFSIR